MPSYRMTLTMLSPVHIGTGEEIDPTQYIVRQRQGGIFFYAVDFPRFLADLDDRGRAEFNAAVDQGGTVYLRKFVARRFNPARHVRWTANASPDLLDAYNKGLDSDSSQLIVHPMTRDAATGRAYLPGSSIKGAIRTAWVSARAAAYSGSQDLEQIANRFERDFEPEVLGYMDRSRGRPRGEIRADPFRALRISDAMLCEGSNAVDPVKIRRRSAQAGRSDPSGIQMFYDATFCLVHNETITAEGRLTVNERLAATPGPRERWNWPHCVAGGMTAAELLKACNTFYLPKLRDEVKVFMEVDPNLASIGRDLVQLAEKVTENEALIRLGRFSHFECVTVDRYRKAPKRGSGATRSMACGNTPLGWARIRLDPL